MLLWACHSFSTLVHHVMGIKAEDAIGLKHFPSLLHVFLFLEADGLILAVVLIQDLPRMRGS